MQQFQSTWKGSVSTMPCTRVCVTRALHSTLLGWVHCSVLVFALAVPSSNSGTAPPGFQRGWCLSSCTTLSGVQRSSWENTTASRTLPFMCTQMCDMRLL